MREADAVIVGARCAGSTLAIDLARRGWDVVLVDHDRFPSETLSTHLIFPNTLARLAELGVLETLLDAHELPLLEFRLLGFGNEISGLFTPIDGLDRCAAPRRVALDEAILDTAVAAGADALLGERVAELIGSGTEEDPVRGVVLANGERVCARWVFGADGRGSTVAGRLGVEKRQPLQGEISYLFAYWLGVPDDGFATTDLGEEAAVSRWAGEDGTCLLAAWGDAEFTRGSKEERLARYLDRLRRFPQTIDADVLDRAQMVSELVVAPESLMRGFYRAPTGPGWALVGDSCHFKHPATAQGISDAVEQALYVAESLSAPQPSLENYEQWRDARAAEHYEWSFAWGRFPTPETEKIFVGWAREADAGQDVRDCLARRVEPSRVMSPERLARWFAS